MIPKKM